MLVQTPSPYSTESPWGYILRISEANGYVTPSHLFKAVGLHTVAYKASRFSMEQLVALVGHDVETLEPLSYSGAMRNGVAAFKVLEQPMGDSYRKSMLRLRHPAFCPHCVSEDGFLDAKWDIKLVVACPRHKCALVDHCSVCNRPVSWYRPGLLTCKCGSSLTESTGAHASQPVTELCSIIINKVHGKPLHTLLNTSGLPIEALESMPLETFFSMLIRLAQQHPDQKVRTALPTPVQTVERAAEALAEWPHGFHRYLRRIGTESSDTDKKSVGMNVRFRNLHGAIFKRRADVSAYGFLLDEYVRFGRTEWGESIVDSRTSSGAEPKRWLSKAEYARRIGVNTSTVDALANDGLLKMKQVQAGTATRYVVDTASSLVPQRAEGRTYKGIDAAKRLGIPLAVLKELRKSGHYQAAHLASRRAAFHEQDVEDFRARLLVRVPLSTGTRPAGKEVVSMTDVLRHFKTGTPVSKATFVAAYLDGTVPALGRYGESLGDVFFDRKLALDFTRGGRLDGRESCSLAAAAEFLQCEPKAVSGLVTDGYVATTSYGYVDKMSLQAFSDAWTPLVKMAREMETSSRRLERLMDVEGIERLTVTPKYRGANLSSFIRTMDVQRLREVCGRNPARKR